MIDSLIVLLNSPTKNHQNVRLSFLKFSKTLFNKSLKILPVSMPALIKINQLIKIKVEY
jgi:hypothetical protein